MLDVETLSVHRTRISHGGSATMPWYSGNNHGRTGLAISTWHHTIIPNSKLRSRLYTFNVVHKDVATNGDKDDDILKPD